MPYRRFAPLSLLLVLTLIACVPERTAQTRAAAPGALKPGAVYRASDVAHDPTGNYCFTYPNGKKSWSSFIVRGTVMKVSPRDRSHRVALYDYRGGRLWKDQNGPGTYEFFAAGGGIWQANNGSGQTMRMRSC